MLSFNIGEHIQAVYDRRVLGTPLNKTQLAGVRSGAGSRAKKKPLLYSQEERRGTRSDSEWLDTDEGTQSRGDEALGRRHR